MTTYSNHFFTKAFQKAEAAFLDRFDPHSLQIRRQALSYFNQFGMPSIRSDDWKYTDLSQYPFASLKPVVKLEGSPASNSMDLSLLNSQFTQQWVFYNGHSLKEFSSNLFSIKQIAKLAISQKPPMNSLRALNQAFYFDGAHLRLPKNCIVEQPIFIVHITHSNSDSVMSHPRNLIIAEEGSQATIVEIYLTEGEYGSFTNTVTDVRLKSGAILKHIILQRGNHHGLQLIDLNVEQAEKSYYSGTLVNLDGAVNRSSIQIDLNGSNAECQFYALALARKHQKIDNHVVLNHNKPNCKSHTITRGVATDKAKNAFTGKIVVPINSYKSEATLESKSLLLSSDAESDLRPQLEIYNNDVQCAHGATVGHLDLEALFYLKSRGLSEKEAKQYLIHAFITPSLQEIPLSIRPQVERLIYEY